LIGFISSRPPTDFKTLDFSRVYFKKNNDPDSLNKLSTSMQKMQL
jgi:hypothetical protein